MKQNFFYKARTDKCLNDSKNIQCLVNCVLVVNMCYLLLKNLGYLKNILFKLTKFTIISNITINLTFL